MRVGVVGLGTIGKRVAEAILRQSDMRLTGVVKTTPDYLASMAVRSGIRLYVPEDKVDEFKRADIPVEGTVTDLVKESDIIVDASPEDVGAENKAKYYGPLDRPAIFQGGEEEDVAEVSFNALANYEKAVGKRYVRVVSCNTTGIARLLSALIGNGIGISKARIFIARRGADPKEYKKGPINDVVPNPATVPSHHGPDVKTVLPDVDIVTMAVAVPTTIMHMHMVYMELDGQYSRDAVVEALARTPRIQLFETRHGFKSLAQIIEWARDMGRKRNDVYENAVIRDSITVNGRELYLMMGVHQEAIVTPENVDAVRAAMRMAGKWESIRETDKSLGIASEGKKYGF